MNNDEILRMYNMTDYYIGLGLALSSSGFIGLYLKNFCYSVLIQHCI